jgi:SAM-dependent methyltransferase
MPTSRWTPEAIRALHPEDLYLAYHAPRYALLLELAGEVTRGWGGNPSESSAERVVVDVGESVCTRLLAEGLGSTAVVHTLDMRGDRDQPHLGARSRNFQVDLNLAAAGLRGDVPRGDLILFSEVLEHLHVAPQHVLRALRSVMKPGGTLILQTPNALALHKRVAMLLGRHPYERLREDARCPGHVREHTLDELRDYARESGFEITRAIRASYFDYRFRLDPRTHEHRRTPRGVAVNAAYAVMPGALRRGITLVMTPR